MDIKEVIRTINQMEVDGIISGYAIGGAVGAIFYLQPTATADVDVFISFDIEPGSLIIDPQPIFDYLKQRGCMMQDDSVMIGGWPVQFLPPAGPLVEEALACAVTMDVQGMKTRVFTAEHLAAIALQTGRAKDKIRLVQFVEAGVLDATRFQSILTRHGLQAAWQKFERQFLSDSP